jgi:hypothetical protein
MAWGKLEIAINGTSLRALETAGEEPRHDGDGRANSQRKEATAHDCDRKPTG